MLNEIVSRKKACRRKSLTRRRSKSIVKAFRNLAAILLIFSTTASVALAQSVAEFDIVFANGRVMDPESNLDAVRYVGIRNGKIAAISTRPLRGRTMVDVKGLVVAPGFIDLHAHGQSLAAQTYQAGDGVTTALELEGGAFLLEDTLNERSGKSLLNYGYSASHWGARWMVKKDNKRAENEALSDVELKEILGYLEKTLDEGALGIGIGLDYVSRGVKESELAALFKLAADRGVPLYIHIRMPDDRNDISGLKELLDLTEKTKASFHMVHIASTGLGRVPAFLKMIEAARKKGLDVTTEVYPYTAGSTYINSGIFDHDWQRKMGIGYEDIEWPPTGERFTSKLMWDEYRALHKNGTVIIHAMKEEMVELALKHPLVMVASDGMPIKSLDERAHPRGMGCFSRVLGRYVREKKLITLLDAIRKMTLQPAQRLEKISPAMRNKGRLKFGSDADITIFDADQVIDRATFANPNQFSKGIIHVLVGGTFVVRNEKIVEGVKPGQAIRGPQR